MRVWWERSCAQGVDALAAYKVRKQVTDLLLVREADYPEGTTLPPFACGYLR